MQPIELHLHLDGLVDYANGGEVHVFVHGPAGRPALSTDSGTTSSPPEVEAMLHRFEAHDPSSAARRVFEELTAKGWVAKMPKPRAGKAKSSAAYIRMVYPGSKEKVVTYINTVALMFDGSNARDIAVAIDGADVRPGGVYFYFSEGRIEQALAAGEVLRTWADGEQVAA